MRQLYFVSDKNLGYKHTIDLLERILMEVELPEKLRYEASKEIEKFLGRKGNLPGIMKAF